MTAGEIAGRMLELLTIDPMGEDEQTEFMGLAEQLATYVAETE